MRQNQFEHMHGRTWRTIENILAGEANAETRKRLPALYRALCQHLVLANERLYSLALIERLDRLASRAHQLLYQQRASRRLDPLTFLGDTFPATVRAHWRWMVAATLLFYVPLLLMIAWMQVDPDLIHALMDSDTIASLEEMYDPANSRTGTARDAETDLGMFGFYIYNNTSIGFRNYASGLLFGIGTLLILLFNSLYIGAAAGHITQAGLGSTFWPFVAGHSALELTAIVISAAGGLKLGFSLLAPGRRTRLDALRQAARETAPLIGGAAAMFVLAAFVEAFWSSRGDVPANIKYAVGAVLWTITLAYFSLLGKHRGT